MCVNHIEREEVTRRGEGNREWTQIDANLWERDRLAGPKRRDAGLGRHESRLAMRPLEKHDEDRDVFGGTPNTAVETTALPMNRISGYSRLSASIRGSRLSFLIIQEGFM